MELPESLVALMQAYPLPREEHRQRALEGDLEFAAGRYARRGTDGGRSGWWRVWREIQHVRGRSLEEALDDLSPQGRRWFALWCFDRGQGAEGAAAYRRYLEQPGKIGPFGAENGRYLDYLLTQEQYADVLSTVAMLVERYDDVPSEQIRAVRAELTLGDAAGARARLEAVRERHHDWGDVWALTAVLEARAGNLQRARDALRECARLGVSDSDLEQELRDALSLTRDEWQRLRAPFEYPSTFWGERETRLWLADPGAQLRPCSEPSPHSFGGVDFRMPACRGCGHLIRQWFALDLRQIEPLRTRLPSWHLFPLLGCVDCMVWMGRHDYEVNRSSNTVRLVNVAISLKLFGEASGTFPEIPRQPARLDWIEPKADPTPEDLDRWGDWEHPQVAGYPAWVQDPLRVYCHSCREEMVFVAAMATTTEFDPVIPINNESGYQYHLACDGCGTISVIAQWT